MSGYVRPNWRDIDIVDLTDAEVAMMTPEEERWCGDLLHQRFLRSIGKTGEVAEYPQEPDEQRKAFTRADIDKAKIAVTETGLRILVYPGEGNDDDCFAGEIINPTERQMLGNGHVSCLWDCSKVISLEGSRP